MNNKGQLGLNVIMMSFIAVIVGVILFQVIAQQAGLTQNTEVVANTSYAAGAAGTTITISNYRALSDVIINNGSSGNAIVPASNYTVNNNQVVNGALATTISVLTGNYTGSAAWRVTAVGQPLTYIPDAGGRALANLIAIFFALAVVVVAISPVLQSKLLEAMGR